MSGRAGAWLRRPSTYKPNAPCARPRGAKMEYKNALLQLWIVCLAFCLSLRIRCGLSAAGRRSSAGQRTDGRWDVAGQRRGVAGLDANLYT